MIIDGIDLPFDYISGSEVWPSNNPKDSPWSRYVCQLCGGEILFGEFGQYSIGGPTPNERAIDRVKWHYDHYPKREKQK